MKKIIIFFVFLMILSCDGSKNRKLILGDWKWVEQKSKTNEEEPPPPFLYSPPEISFKENGEFINKDGIYLNLDKSRDIDESGTKSVRYLGTKSKYRINGNSLEFYNPGTKKFDKTTIVTLTSSDLIYKTEDGTTFHFKRQSPKKQISNISFSDFVVTNGSCFGSCPIKSVRLRSNGEIIYDGDSYNSINGFFVGHFNQNKFKELNQEFNTIDINMFDDSYTASAADLSTTNISLIQNSKIYRSISDYGGQSPIELRRLMNEIGWMYQNAKLQPANFKLKQISEIFSNPKDTLTLTESELFYLKTELVSAQKSTQNFTPIFNNWYYDLPKDKIDEWSKYRYKLETDGRFFRFKLKGNSEETLDLGYNFFERNFPDKFRQR